LFCSCEIYKYVIPFLIHVIFLYLLSFIMQLILFASSVF
jgi:hypothetical protein